MMSTKCSNFLEALPCYCYTFATQLLSAFGVPPPLPTVDAICEWSQRKFAETNEIDTDGDDPSPFDFLGSLSKVYRPKVKYVSNAKPYNVYKWPFSLITSTTT